jgi:hypothetical protein
MTLGYYLFVVSFYLLGGFCLYFVGNKLLSHSNNKKTAKKIFPVLCIGLTLTGFIFVTYGFFYCRSVNVQVLRCSVGIIASNPQSFVDSPIRQGCKQS